MSSPSGRGEVEMVPFHGLVMPSSGRTRVVSRMWCSAAAMLRWCLFYLQSGPLTRTTL